MAATCPAAFTPTHRVRYRIHSRTTNRRANTPPPVAAGFADLDVLMIKVTHLARGLPVGGSVEYTDEMTLSRAFQGRQELLGWLHRGRPIAKH